MLDQVLQAIGLRKRPLRQWRFALTAPDGVSLGNVDAMATDAVAARHMIMQEIDPSKVIIGPASPVK